MPFEHNNMYITFFHVHVHYTNIIPFIIIYYNLNFAIRYTSLFITKNTQKKAIHSYFVIQNEGEKSLIVPIESIIYSSVVNI